MNPDNARRILEGLEKLPPEKSPVEKRMELEHLLASPVIGEHAGNAAAVLEGYKSGQLAYVPAHYYIYKNGKKEAGPRPLSGFDPEKVLWGEYPNPRGVWIESVNQPFPVLELGCFYSVVHTMYVLIDLQCTGPPYI